MGNPNKGYVSSEGKLSPQAEVWADLANGSKDKIAARMRARRGLGAQIKNIVTLGGVGRQESRDAAQIAGAWRASRAGSLGGAATGARARSPVEEAAYSSDLYRLGAAQRQYDTSEAERRRQLDAAADTRPKHRYSDEPTPGSVRGYTSGRYGWVDPGKL